MDTFVKHVLDEKNRILLPQKLREQLKWHIGNTLSAILSQDGKTVTLKRVSVSAGVLIDSHGRITLPNQVLDATNWSAMDTLGVSLDTKNNTISLELNQKANDSIANYMGCFSGGGGMAPDPW